MKRGYVTAVIWKEGKRFVSKCPELGVASYGKTPEAARDALKEAIALYIENAQRLGLIKELAPALSAPIHYTSPVEIALA
jgi:predicted RNase H-like HicB family nuclease